jgi:CRISPR-associated endonuclease/helicase Cas3
MRRRDPNFRPKRLQKYSYKHRNQNLILIAQTGMGKSEASYLWVDESKAFITLPLRVSLNAQYDRVVQGLGYRNNDEAFVGLLHSGAQAYRLQQNENVDIQDIKDDYNEAKLLSEKVTFCTVDQVFKFPFLYKGYEKHYVNFAHSKIVIDEIQAYSPMILAVLIKGLEMIHRIGGQFMIMTATLPTIFLQKLLQRGVITEQDYEKKEFWLNSLKRHSVSLSQNSIDSAFDQIIDKSRRKKVLVIANTVRKANDLFQELKSRGANVRLVHSRFAAQDRYQLENEIKRFAPNKKTENNQEPGIWITTQIVEASIDIDFDFLFTELSTLDSLFQRMGRVYRNRNYYGHTPNVFVFAGDCSGIRHVYDPVIHERSFSLLSNVIGSGHLLESTKMNLVETLYDENNLRGSTYEEHLRESLRILDNMESYEMSNRKAQQLLRDIDSVTIVPEGYYQQHKELFTEFESLNRPGSKKINARRILELRTEIDKLMVSVPYFYFEGNPQSFRPLTEYYENYYVFTGSYDWDGQTGCGIML